MKALEKYNSIFMSVFDVSEAELNEGFTFKDTENWNSMAHLTLITELEDAFEIMFDTDDVLHYGSYLNGIEILKRYGVEF